MGMLRDVLRSVFRLGVRLGGGGAFVLGLLGAGCAYEQEGFDAIDGRRRLSDLSASESQLVCDWMSDQASSPSGLTSSTALRCSRGLRPHAYLRFADRCPDPRETQCPTTLRQVRRCIPDLLEALASQSCGAGQVDSLADLDALVKQVSSCRGVARCAYHPPSHDDGDDLTVHARSR